MKIDRKSVRAAVREELIRRIVTGQVSPGARLNETTLAQEFGVSQTPVREALFGMELEGFLESQVGKGFFVAPLSIREVEETFPLLGNLEAMALRTAGLPDQATLDELRKINARMSEASAKSAHSLDTKWHERLLEHCPNARLMMMIASLKRAVYRYDFAYMQEASASVISTATHDRILKSLEAGRLSQAAKELDKNWTYCVPRIVKWLTDSLA